MRAVIVMCGILAGALWHSAFAPARAAVPGQGAMSLQASALSKIIAVKKKGIPGWWRGHCPPGQWKKGRC